MLFILKPCVMFCPLGLLHSSARSFYHLVSIQSIPLRSVLALKSYGFVCLFIR